MSLGVDVVDLLELLVREPQNDQLASAARHPDDLHHTAIGQLQGVQQKLGVEVPEEQI